MSDTTFRHRHSDSFWVFGYGSLMWNPGFDFVDVYPALLRGYHRAFCVYSVVYRGTPECPGLVLGLDHGGSCLGKVYRVATEKVADVTTYLNSREMVTSVYQPKVLPVCVGGRIVPAHTYVVDRRHSQYARNITTGRVVEIIRRGAGCAGDNRSYLRDTVHHLDMLGLGDGPLHQLLDWVERDTQGAPNRNDPKTLGVVDE